MVAKILINPVTYQKEPFEVSSLIQYLDAQGLATETTTLPELAAEPMNPPLKWSRKERKKNSKQRLILLGGDGTLHQVINAVGLESLSRYEIMLIPSGTGNDLARSLSIPLNPRKACDILNHFGKSVEIDLGMINDKLLFSCAMSIGFGAEVTKFATRSIRNWVGRAALLWGALRYLLKKAKPMLRVKLHYRGKKRTVTTQHLVIGNSKYHGGGFPITPRSDLQSGCLELYRVKPLGFWDYVPLIGKIVTRQDHTIYRKKIHSFRLREMVMELLQPTDVDVDGELYHFSAGPYIVRVLPRALTVLAPDWETYRRSLSRPNRLNERLRRLRRRGASSPRIAI